MLTFTKAFFNEVPMTFRHASSIIICYERVCCIGVNFDKEHRPYRVFKKS